MTSVSDGSQSFHAGAASRGFPRQPRRLPPQLQPIAAQPVLASETVTLGKIGDFLEIDFRRLFAWLRAGLLGTGLLAVVGAGAGAAYAILTPPKYTVDSEILIDPANLQVVTDDLYQAPGQVDSQLLNAGSKLRILTSGNVLARVVDQLDLVDDPEFVVPPSTGGMFSFLGGSSSDSARSNPKIEALAALERRVATKADEKSFVATLMVSSESPDKSIRISDAVVAAFKDELAKAESDGASRTAKALNDRLSELKSDVKTAEEKVEGFKRANGLASSSGELVSTQAMTQVNTQVSDAQGRLIAAQSAYNELVSAGSNVTSTDAQESQTLTTLRAQAADLKQQFNAQSMTYGPRHPSIVRLGSQLATANAQLEAEIGRIVGSAKATLDEAKSALAALTAQASTLKADVFTDNEALVTLRELERDSTSKGAIYEAFLSRAKQVAEREQIDTTNIRVISTAVPPAARSWPPRTVVVMGMGAAGGVALGLLLAICIGIVRDMRRDRRAAGARTA